MVLRGQDDRRPKKVLRGDTFFVHRCCLGGGGSYDVHNCDDDSHKLDGTEGTAKGNIDASQTPKKMAVALDGRRYRT